jgi:hypothetical protein
VVSLSCMARTSGSRNGAVWLNSDR